MPKYYVNNTPQENGDHEVHKNTCVWFLIAKNTTYLGEFPNCKGAVKEAQKKYKTANGCKHCSLTCHTS